MGARTKLNELIKLKERPEATLSLVQALKDPIKTVGTYVFTDSIRGYFEEILERAARGSGGGFWIQAEYGAGKTHFLATLTCLLTNMDEKIWDEVQDEEIRGYKRRLQSNKLFPVIFSLKGEGGIDVSEENLLTVIERQIEEALEATGEREDVEVTTDDEVVRWYNESSLALKDAIGSFVKLKTVRNPEELEKERLSEFVREYCKESKIRPQITATTKERIRHIYNQLKKLGYTGILFVIDEFATWQRRHPRGTLQYNQDEDVLETLSWVLPRDLKLNIYTIIASAEPALIKLRGERLRECDLFSGENEREFDIIVSQRVRELVKEKLPEIDQYYEYYRKEFEFLKGVDKAYFYDIFPYQPKCFEVIRKIASKSELYTTRAGIYYVYEVTNNDSVLSQDSLIRTSELLLSYYLSRDLAQIFSQAHTSYQTAMSGVEDIALDDKERDIAEQVIQTLFLWYAASPEPPRPLSVRELTEMTLTPSDIIKGSDLVESVLVKLRDLPQINYTKEKGAIFKVTEKEAATYSQRFTKRKRKIVEPSEIQECWERGLIFSPIETGGRKGLFADLEYDKRITMELEFKKVKYPGEVILSKAWRSEYGERVKDDLHFRIIALTKKTELDLSELKDPRIAVCIPSELTQAAEDAARDYLAITGMAEDCKNKNGAEAEEARAWINNKKREVIHNLLIKQIGIYKSGITFTQQSIGIDEKKVFSSDILDKMLTQIVAPILGGTYTSQPFDSVHFKKVLSGGDAKKIFGGFCKKEPSASAVSACENYGVVLGLSRYDEPKKFNPAEDNQIFEIFLERLKQNNGEVQIWKLYQELESPPYGLLRELVTLYLLCFVRANPNVELRLKSGHPLALTLKSGKITSFDVQNVDWRGKFDEGFDVLGYTTDITWDSTLPYARVINPELKSVTSPDDIMAQETRLIQSLTAIKDVIPQIRRNLETLSGIFGVEVGTEVKVLDKVQEISDSTNFQDFYRVLNNLYPNTDVPNSDLFIADFRMFENIKVASEQSTMLLQIKAYIDDSVLPADDELSSKKISLQSKTKLSSILKKTELIEEIRSDFEKFKSGYSNKYQIHHRDYHAELSDLKRNLSYVKDKVVALDRLRKLGIVSQPAVSEEEYQDFFEKMGVCTGEDLVNVDAMPICQKCKLTLGTKAPTSDVEKCIREVEESIHAGMSKLSQMLKPVLSIDEEGKLNVLVEFLEKEKDVTRLPSVLTDDIVDYLQELIKKANIQSVHTEVLDKLARDHSFIEEKDIEQAVAAFRKELKDAFENAKNEYPGKKIRIVLK